MGQSMMKIKVNRQGQKENPRKTESQGREDARKTDAEAQGQENVYQEEGRIISASVDEDMLEDIAKEVILYELHKLWIDSFSSSNLPQEKKPELLGGKWLQIEKTSHSEIV